MEVCQVPCIKQESSIKWKEEEMAQGNIMQKTEFAFSVSSFLPDNLLELL